MRDCVTNSYGWAARPQDSVLLIDTHSILCPPLLCLCFTELLPTAAVTTYNKIQTHNFALHWEKYQFLPSSSYQFQILLTTENSYFQNLRSGNVYITRISEWGICTPEPHTFQILRTTRWSNKRNVNPRIILLHPFFLPMSLLGGWCNCNQSRWLDMGTGMMSRIWPRGMCRPTRW